MVKQIVQMDIMELEGSSPKFIYKCRDHAMINAFIPPGAELVIDPCLEPVNGNIVVAELYNKILVRYIQINTYKSKLIAANRNFPDIEIRPTNNLKILGVVSRILIDPMALKNLL